MSEPLREIEGTWEEVVLHEAELRGHHVKLTVFDGNGMEQEASPASDTFKGKPITDFDAYLASIPHIDNDAEFAAFEVAIAKERSERRRIASETAD